MGGRRERGGMYLDVFYKSLFFFDLENSRFYALLRGGLGWQLRGEGYSWYYMDVSYKSSPRNPYIYTLHLVPQPLYPTPPPHPQSTPLPIPTPPPPLPLSPPTIPNPLPQPAINLIMSLTHPHSQPLPPFHPRRIPFLVHPRCELGRARPAWVEAPKQVQEGAHLGLFGGGCVGGVAGG